MLSIQREAALREQLKCWSQWGLGWEGNLSLVSQESAWKDVVMPDILSGQISPVHFEQ